jgi:hypothetical protein
MDSFFGGVILGDERTKTAAALIEKHIDLGLIEPSDLFEIVKPSGLVSSDALFEAYEAHALRARGIAPAHAKKRTNAMFTWEAGI